MKTRKRASHPRRPVLRGDIATRFRPGNQIGKATRFKAGAPSANPGGRPSCKLISQASREKLAETISKEELRRYRLPLELFGQTYAQCIAFALRREALNGSIAAAAELADRSEGKPRVSIGIGDDTDPLTQLVESMTSIGSTLGPPPQDDESIEQADARVN